MRKHAVVIVACALLILFGTLATWVLVTLPPDIEPSSIPSQVFEPPPATWMDAVEEGRSHARTLLAEEKLPGLSVAVAVQGEIVWAEGFRWADMESETPVTPATRFRIGGITEAITAAAVGLLSERGRLDLDVPVQRYVPGFPEKRWPITTRQLMSHTAGIRAHRGEGGILRGSCADDAERLALFAEDSLRSRPGTRFSYSTFGWVLVGAVVASVTGQSCLDFVQGEILDPLGMRDTVPEVAGQGEEGRATFYYPRMMLEPRYGLQPSPAVDLSCYLPAAGLLSTPSDLVRFGSAMMQDTLLEAATIEELQTPVSLESGESTGVALGWVEQSIPTGKFKPATRMVGRGLGDVVRRGKLGVTTVGGQVAGATTTLLLVPEHRIAIAVAANVSAAENVPQLATRLAVIFVRFHLAR